MLTPPPLSVGAKEVVQILLEFDGKLEMVSYGFSVRGQ
jgi:hypothetical protein